MQSGAEAPLSLRLYEDKRNPARRSAERQPDRHLVCKFANASVERCFRLQARDFVLHQQLATFQCHDLKIIDRWVGPRFIDFCLKGPMTSFQFRKMGFYGHVVEFSSVSWYLTRPIVH